MTVSHIEAAFDTINSCRDLQPTHRFDYATVNAVSGGGISKKENLRGKRVARYPGHPAFVITRGRHALIFPEHKKEAKAPETTGLFQAHSQNGTRRVSSSPPRPLHETSLECPNDTK